MTFSKATTVASIAVTVLSLSIMSVSASHRHWATLIPSQRLASLTLDDEHLHLPPRGRQSHARDDEHDTNPTSPQSISSAIELAHDDAVSAAIASGASISEIENLSLTNGNSNAVTSYIVDMAHHSTNPASESSPHLFSMAPSSTQPWFDRNEMDKFVGGAMNLRPDIEEWIDIVLPELHDEVVKKLRDGSSLEQIIAGVDTGGGNTGGGAATVSVSSSAGTTATSTAMTTTASGGATGSYTIDPVTGVYLDSNGNVVTDPSVLPGGAGATSTTPATASGTTTGTTATWGFNGDLNGDPTKDFSDLLPNNNSPPITPTTATGTTSSSSVGMGTPTAPSTQATATQDTVSTPATSTAAISDSPLSTLQAYKPKPPPTSKLDPTIQGGVELQASSVLPYPLSLPWYPKDGQPWIDPPSLPTYDNPIIDAINAAPSTDVKNFIRNQYWEDGYWSPESYYGYGPPCSVSEVVTYNTDMIARGKLPVESAEQIRTAVGVDGKINGGKAVMELTYRGDQKWLGAGTLGRCEGDCDEGTFGH